MELEKSLPVVADAEGTSFAGRAMPVVVRTAGWTSLPPFPGMEVVNPAVIRAPPMVPADGTDAAKAQLLLDAYSQTLRRKLPREFNPHLKHGLKAAERKLLIAAASALQTHEVSPLRWCEFSFDVWEHGRQQDKAEGRKERAARPALRVVFALSRIEETAGWARAQYERRGSQVVMTRTLRTLLERWQSMMAAVLRGEVSAAEAAAKFFPDGMYDRLVEKARSEAQREQANLDTRLRAGEYLW